jgi:hypothetical protein
VWSGCAHVPYYWALFEFAKVIVPYRLAPPPECPTAPTAVDSNNRLKIASPSKLGGADSLCIPCFFNTNYLKTALFTKYGYLPPIHSAPEVRSAGNGCIFKEEAADAQELISSP